MDKLLNNLHAYSPGVYRQIGIFAFLWRDEGKVSDDKDANHNLGVALEDAM